MDENRVRNFFGKRSYDAPNNQVAGFGSVSRERESNFPQQIISNPGDIILTQKPKKKKNLAIVLILVFLIIVSIGVTFFFINNSKTQGDGGITDDEVLIFADDSYGKISAIQSTFIKGKQGSLQVMDFFSEENKNGLNEMVVAMEDFQAKLNEYNPALISNEYVRESYFSLKSALDNDMPLYTDLFNLYSLFYDYVNSGYDRLYAEAITNLNDDRILKALNGLDAAVKEYGSYQAGTIVQDIFSISLGENYPEIYYYELMGNIIGGLKDDE